MDSYESSYLLDTVKREIKLNQELLNFLQQQDFTKVLHWFKDLCSHLSKTILITSKYHKNKKLDEPSKNGLLLYLWQTITILAHLINIFVKENEIKQNLWLSRDYAKNQLSSCLEGILEILSSKSTIFEPPNFVKLMDSALEKTDGIQQILEEDKCFIKEELETIIREAKSCTEDVLCHSMSIAQVILKTDYIIVRGKVQMVLEILDLLSKELDKEISNSSMIRLYTDSCCDKLCSLENTVNTAVLKLTLQVFSEFSRPLEQICDACNENGSKSSSDLDTLVANFDLHVDRIMQIGLFAAACSVNESRSIKIRSCLASLESLETELVPALTATLKNPTLQNASHSFLLKAHWLQQANLLKKYIYLIIDPFAFCQVLYLESKQTIDIYQESLKSYTRESIIDHVENLLKLTNIVKEFMIVTSNELEGEAEKNRTTYKDFLKVLNEVQTAKTVLLKEENFNPENNFRMLKRCKILLTQIKKLLYCFSTSQQENQNSVEEQSVPTENVSNHEETMAVANPFLAHIIKKGKQILKDRSVLYKSPQKNCNKNNMRFNGVANRTILKNTENIFTKSKSLRKLCFLKNTTVQNDVSMDLQITDILNELTNMTETFNS